MTKCDELLIEIFNELELNINKLEAVQGDCTKCVIIEELATAQESITMNYPHLCKDFIEEHEQM